MALRNQAGADITISYSRKYGYAENVATATCTGCGHSLTGSGRTPIASYASAEHWAQGHAATCKRTA